MISRHLHGYLYHLPFLLLTHWHIIFRICIFSFSSCISTRTSRLFFALRMPFRFPWADHAIKILRIIVSFLIVFSSGFCSFCLSSNALIHYCLSFLLKKKHFHANTNTVIIFALSIAYVSGARPGLHIVLHSQRVECCPSVSPSGFTAVSSPKSSALPTLHLDSDFLVFVGIKGIEVSCLQLSPFKCDVKCCVKLF